MNFPLLAFFKSTAQNSLSLLRSLVPSSISPTTATSTVAATTDANTAASDSHPRNKTMASDAQTKRLLCWTVCAYRKEGLSEDEYHRHMSQVHAPLVKAMMVKYNFVGWTMVKPLSPSLPPFPYGRCFPPMQLTQPKTHNTTETRELMKQLVGPQFNATADYDCIVQCMFHDVADFVAMKKDPFYIEHVMPDHERFADTRRSK